MNEQPRITPWRVLELSVPFITAPFAHPLTVQPRPFVSLLSPDARAGPAVEGRQPGTPWSAWLLRAHTWDSAPAQQPPFRDISLPAAPAFEYAQEAFAHHLCMSVQPGKLLSC